MLFFFLKIGKLNEKGCAKVQEAYPQIYNKIKKHAQEKEQNTGWKPI